MNEKWTRVIVFKRYRRKFVRTIPLMYEAVGSQSHGFLYGTLPVTNADIQVQLSTSTGESPFAFRFTSRTGVIPGIAALLSLKAMFLIES